MDALRRGLVSALSVAAALLLLAAAAPRAGAAATRLRALTPAAETAGGAGAGAGAAGPPAGDPAVAAKLLSSTSLSSYSLASLSDAVVLAFRNSYKDLGVSMDQLMDAETAGNLAEYEATINEQRNSSLNMVSTIAQYRTIMQSLHTSGRCLDFVRQSTTDDPTACDVPKWRRCCRGTANDTDQVLFCGTLEKPQRVADVQRGDAPRQQLPRPAAAGAGGGTAAAVARSVAGPHAAQRWHPLERVDRPGAGASGAAAGDGGDPAAGGADDGPAGHGRALFL